MLFRWLNRLLGRDLVRSQQCCRFGYMSKSLQLLFRPPLPRLSLLLVLQLVRMKTSLVKRSLPVFRGVNPSRLHRLTGRFLKCLSWRLHTLRCTMLHRLTNRCSGCLLRWRALLSHPCPALVTGTRMCSMCRDYWTVQVHLTLR